MPNQDQTGPLGQGQLTGRGLGPCGRGLRQGFNRGFRQRVILTQDQEKKILEEELKEMELDKKEIEKRLKDIK